KRWTMMGITVVLLLISGAAFFTKWVAVKMLPFDNKNEIQVVIDMPEGTTLERTSAVTQDIAQYLKTVPEVVNYQNYIGSSAPITFNSLVRHYDMRGNSNTADIQVNLLHKEDRNAQSHDVAKNIRPEIQKIASKNGANVKIVEVPPGPPVLSTIVAEIYGPDYDEQIRIANQVMTLIEETEGVVDTDWMTEADQPEYSVEVDKEKSMRYGVAPAQVVATVNAALSDMPAGVLHVPVSFDPVSIVLQLNEADKAGIQDTQNLKVINQQGNAIPVGDLVS